MAMNQESDGIKWHEHSRLADDIALKMYNGVEVTNSLNECNRRVGLRMNATAGSVYDWMQPQGRFTNQPREVLDILGQHAQEWPNNIEKED